MLEVSIDSSRPIFVRAKPQDIGDIFARTGSGEQAEILRVALTTIQREFPMQADYIALELAKPEHAETRRLLAYLIEPIPAEA